MRVLERRRKPFMSAYKWTALALLIILSICFLVIKTYQSIQSDRWSEAYYVKSSLREYFVYDTIEFAKKYSWDEMYWLVKGQTADDTEKIVVWQDLEILQSVPVSELLTDIQISEKLKEADREMEIEHIQPAYFRDYLSYEVQTRAETGHLVISFYTMNEGKLIDQFTLPN